MVVSQPDVELEAAEVENRTEDQIPENHTEEERRPERRPWIWFLFARRSRGRRIGLGEMRGPFDFFFGF